MNDTRVMDKSAKSAATERLASGKPRTAGSAGERVLGSQAFSTSRGDRGHVVLLAEGPGLVMLQRMELSDGSVLEWTRTLRDADSLSSCLRGLTLSGNAEAARLRLLRLAKEYFARSTGV